MCIDSTGTSISDKFDFDGYFARFFTGLDAQNSGVQAWSRQFFGDQCHANQIIASVDYFLLLEAQE